MTEFKIDVMIGGTKEEHKLVQQKRYGFSEEDAGIISTNECSAITSGKNGFLQPQKIFLLNLEKHPLENIPIFIHELWHLMWDISVVIEDLKLNKKSSSWAACMIETISGDIINAKYEELNLEYGE